MLKDTWANLMVGLGQMEEGGSVSSLISRLMLRYAYDQVCQRFCVATFISVFQVLKFTDFFFFFPLSFFFLSPIACFTNTSYLCWNS